MTELCPTCGSDQFETIGEVSSPTCCECGLVISEEVDPPDPIDDTSEQRAAESWSEHYSVTNSTEQQTAQGLEYLDSLRIELRIPKDAINKAVDVFANASIENLAKGRSLETIVAATVCIGARTAESPRPAGAIAEAVDIDANKLEHTIRLIHRTLDREYAPVAPRAYIDYLCDELKLAARTEDQAVELVKTYETAHSVSGKNPVGIAAAGVYKAASQQVTQREVADVAGVTQETIRVRRNELLNAMGED